MTCLKKNITNILWGIISWVTMTPVRVFAQDNGPLADVQGVQNPIASESLQQFLGNVLDAFVTLLYPVIILALVYAGFLFVTAQGNPQQLQKARNVLKWTVVGIIIILARWMIAAVVETTVNEVRVSE